MVKIMNSCNNTYPLAWRDQVISKYENVIRIAATRPVVLLDICFVKKYAAIGINDPMISMGNRATHSCCPKIEKNNAMIKWVVMF